MSSPKSEAVLQTRGLSISYGQVEAVRGADIRVAPGEVVTVIGPNGAGKSSLLNALMGLLPAGGRSGGEIRYSGRDVSHDAVEQRLGHGLALVPEKRELFSTMTVEDNLVLGAYRRRRSRDWRDGLEHIYATFPRLKERRQQLAGTLSGGERQMLAIGRALMSGPRVLMLDEPSLGLAPLVMVEVFRVIGRLRETGIATLLIEQNSRAALQVSDYGYVLEAGTITLEGQATDLMQDDRLVDAYLGSRR